MARTTFTAGSAPRRSGMLLAIDLEKDACRSREELAETDSEAKRKKSSSA